MRYTPENISTLKNNEIFVFGSNLAGRHGSGAARFAMNNFGAEWGVGDGPTGKCYAIPTMQGDISTIAPYVDRFIEFATNNTNQIFYVTKIGCGVAGFTSHDIAPLFKKAISISNIILPREFVDIINNNNINNNNMPKNIKIKCPICGAVLIVVDMPGIEEKTVPCPICKTVTKFTNYIKPEDNHIKKEGDKGTKKTKPKETEGTETEGTETEEITEPDNLKNYVIGKIQILGSTTQYSLKVGKNIIGRKAISSSADIQIATEDKTMSRLHSLIEVVKLTNGGYKHYFSNAENKNPTFVNKDKVVSDDKLILNGDEIIKMGNVVLKFTIAGGEDTDYL